MKEAKGQVNVTVECPQCGTGLDLSKFHINPETLTEEVTEGQYRRPNCVCGCRFGYNLIREALDEVNTAPQG